MQSRQCLRSSRGPIHITSVDFAEINDHALAEKYLVVFDHKKPGEPRLGILDSKEGLFIIPNLPTRLQNAFDLEEIKAVPNCPGRYFALESSGNILDFSYNARSGKVTFHGEFPLYASSVNCEAFYLQESEGNLYILHAPRGGKFQGDKIRCDLSRTCLVKSGQTYKPRETSTVAIISPSASELCREFVGTNTAGDIIVAAYDPEELPGADFYSIFSAEVTAPIHFQGVKVEAVGGIVRNGALTVDVFTDNEGNSSWVRMKIEGSQCRYAEKPLPFGISGAVGIF